MTAEQALLTFSVLELRELLVAKFAVIAVMRPGEIFGLMERVYRGR